MDLISIAFLGNLHPALGPIMIFCARILDVSLGTLRIMLVGRGLRLASSILGFLEVLIWLLAIREIVTNLDSIVNLLSYCAGFAAGTFVGMSIERRLAIGSVLVRIITRRPITQLTTRLAHAGYRFTSVSAEGSRGPVMVIFAVLPRRVANSFLSVVRANEPESFYTVEDVRVAGETLAGVNQPAYRNLLGLFHWYRKGK
jgi:uncharacterized protein YebE (UPF0316 family)